MAGFIPLNNPFREGVELSGNIRHYVSTLCCTEFAVGLDVFSALGQVVITTILMTSYPTRSKEAHRLKIGQKCDNLMAMLKFGQFHLLSIINY